jgi:hypothetical protein
MKRDKMKNEQQAKDRVLVLTGSGYRTTAHEPSCSRLKGTKRRSISLRSELDTLVKACAKCKPTWANQRN